ncbi:MAG: hypothetical protein ACOX7E_01160 [Paludibacter sp.]|jgi:hypothetical protein
MILAFVHNITTSTSLVQSAYALSVQFKKTFGVFVICASQSDEKIQQIFVSEQLNTFGIHPDYLAVQTFQLNDLTEICEAEEASFLFLQLSDNKVCTIKKHLSACRKLRIPYLMYKDSFDVLCTQKVLVPVNFLIEEIEKAQFASAFGRFCQSEITLLQAKDYGTKAAGNVAKISTILDKFNLIYHVEIGRKDSFKIDSFALQYACKNNYDLLIISASREYGLDDIVFGPKELHLIKKTDLPIMLINPRDDLYVLCD